MKLKTLRKKISKLEARLKEAPAKLAKLKRKLETMTAANAAKAKRKSAARAAVTGLRAKSSTATHKKRSPVSAEGRATPAGGKRRKKAKRKLNLSPERRAQLAAAMKARWAAKRASVDPTPQKTADNRDFTIGEIPSP
jgi:chromosome segregation ATPase